MQVRKGKRKASGCGQQEIGSSSFWSSKRGMTKMIRTLRWQSSATSARPRRPWPPPCELYNMWLVDGRCHPCPMSLSQAMSPRSVVRAWGTGAIGRDGPWRWGGTAAVPGSHVMDTKRARSDTVGSEVIGAEPRHAQAPFPRAVALRCRCRCRLHPLLSVDALPTSSLRLIYTLYMLCLNSDGSANKVHQIKLPSHQTTQNTKQQQR